MKLQPVGGKGEAYHMGIVMLEGRQTEGMFP
jgi:hypothetical protein